MSWDIDIVSDHKIATVDNHMFGGTYIAGGTTDASLNITYNYSSYYYYHLDKKKGLRWLDGKKTSECIRRLCRAVDILGIEQDDDYWRATPGNAGYALWILLKWAILLPDATFKVV